jgi:SsrA-binding protein
MAKDKSTKKEKRAPATVQNRKARFDYHISDTVEAGLVLLGSEVKSLFLGQANLTDAYCRVIKGEMWLLNLDIEPYDKSSAFQHERRRDRKCLLHRKEIEVLERKALEKGFTLLPLSIYFKNGKAKVQIGLGRGKANYDKRTSIAEKDTRKEMERARSLKF